MELTDLSLEELQNFYNNFPENSACDRARKEKLRQYLETRLAEQDNGIS